MAACCVPEDAVKEVAQVYEHIKTQQPLLLLHCSSSMTTHQLAQSLLSEALRALNVALSVMTTKQQQPSPAPATTTPISIVKAEPHQPSSPSGGPGGDQAVTRSAGNKRRRSTTTMEAAAASRKTSSSSWAGLTTVPYEDGYEWRKYGEKKINGTSYTRSYFRCTYKDDTGCLATKYVQQKDSSDPPVFHVTYNNKHTCRNNDCTTTTTAAAAAAAMNNIKQEPAAVVLMPPLTEASALPFHEQQTPLQLFARDIPSTSSSCISGGESCDEYYSPGATMEQQMAADQEPSAGADYLTFYDYDLDLLLLCDSFKDY